MKYSIGLNRRFLFRIKFKSISPPTMSNENVSFVFFFSAENLKKIIGQSASFPTNWEREKLKHVYKSLLLRTMKESGTHNKNHRKTMSFWSIPKIIKSSPSEQCILLHLHNARILRTLKLRKMLDRSRP
jgi:hypothetical protein